MTIEQAIITPIIINTKIRGSLKGKRVPSLSSFSLYGYINYPESVDNKHLKKAEIDFLHGRVSTDVFMRYYFNSVLIEDVKIRAFQGTEEIQKKISQFLSFFFGCNSSSIPIKIRYRKNEGTAINTKGSGA